MWFFLSRGGKQQNHNENSNSSAERDRYAEKKRKSHMIYVCSARCAYMYLSMVIHMHARGVHLSFQTKNSIILALFTVIFCVCAAFMNIECDNLSTRSNWSKIYVGKTCIFIRIRINTKLELEPKKNY